MFIPPTNKVIGLGFLKHSRETRYSNWITSKVKQSCGDKGVAIHSQLLSKDFIICIQRVVVIYYNLEGHSITSVLLVCWF